MDEVINLEDEVRYLQLRHTYQESLTSHITGCLDMAAEALKRAQDCHIELYGGKSIAIDRCAEIITAEKQAC